MDSRVRGIRGAITVEENTAAAIAEAVTELLDEIEARNRLNTQEIVCVFFTATPDLDAMFPAAATRTRPGWEDVPLLDLQQMIVRKDLPRCIRILIQVNTVLPQSKIVHCYLRQARTLRPDWNLAVTIKH